MSRGSARANGSFGGRGGVSEGMQCGKVGKTPPEIVLPCDTTQDGGRDNSGSVRKWFWRLAARLMGK